MITYEDLSLLAALRSFFVLMLCPPPVNEKREQTEINNAQRLCRTSFPRTIPQLPNVDHIKDHRTGRRTRRKCYVARFTQFP
jgi:hypothetical protein